MNDGWIIEKNGTLALWSGKKIRGIRGLPTVSSESDARSIVGMGRVCLAVIMSGKSSGIYVSEDGLEWAILSTPPERVETGTQFCLDTDACTVSYVQERMLYIVDRSGVRTVELPNIGLSSAATTRTGDWIVVGKDVDDPSANWNSGHVAWLLKAGSSEWIPLVLAVSKFQAFLIRNVYEIDRLSGIDVRDFPRLFLGCSNDWGGWCCDTLFVESETGHYRPVRRPVGVISSFGRSQGGVPYYTTTRGEFMEWNGRNFTASGWRSSLANLVKDLPGSVGHTEMAITDKRVRGVMVKGSMADGFQTVVFSSEDSGARWHRWDFGLERDGWRVFLPFVRPD